MAQAEIVDESAVGSGEGQNFRPSEFFDHFEIVADQDSRIVRNAVDDHAAHFHIPSPQFVDGQNRVIDRPERGVRNDDDRNAEPRRNIRHDLPLIQRNIDPSRAFQKNHIRIEALPDLAVCRGDLLQINLDAHQLGRRFGRPSWNFGFSGAAKMEPEVVDLLGTLHPAVFILDPMPNMGLEEIRKRAKPFLMRLRKHCPETPFLLLEDAPKTNGWFFPEKYRDNVRRWNAMRRIWHELREKGERRIFYLKGNTLFGTDGEACVDGVHPSDMGYVRMMEQLVPALKKILR